VSEILFLCHRLPYPPDKGEKIRAWHLLDHLRRSFTVHLGCFIDDPRERRHEGRLEELCGETCFKYIDRSPWSARNLGALVGGRPISLAHFRSPGMAAWVDDLTRRRRLAAVYAYSGAMAQYLPADAPEGCRRIIDFVDVDSQKWARYAETVTGPLRWIYARETRRLAAFERQSARNSEACVFVSAYESAIFRDQAPESAAKVVTIENGVDTRRFAPDSDLARPSEMEGGPWVVFVGVMDYRPNVDGILWFCDRVLPVVRETVPGLRLCVVGSRPTRAVRRLARLPGVQVTGAVAAVQPYLQHADAVVVPLRIAQGVPNKVLEAMAMERPVVTTPAAIRGLGRVTPGRDIVVEETAGGIAQALAGLLGDPAGALTIARSARVRVCQHYGWDASLERLDRLMQAGPGGLGADP
jgi:sugar transferase (PEP-CTERM/EpsH1 system associated)